MFSPPSSCLTWCGGWPPELSLWITLFRDPCSMWDLEIHRKLLIGYFPSWGFRAFQQSPWLYCSLFSGPVIQTSCFRSSSEEECGYFPPSVEEMLVSVWEISQNFWWWSSCEHILSTSLRSARISCSVLLLQKYEWYLMALFRAWVLCSRLFL